MNLLTLMGAMIVNCQMQYCIDDDDASRVSIIQESQQSLSYDIDITNMINYILV